MPYFTPSRRSILLIMQTKSCKLLGGCICFSKCYLDTQSLIVVRWSEKLEWLLDVQSDRAVFLEEYWPHEFDFMAVSKHCRGLVKLDGDAPVVTDSPCANTTTRQNPPICDLSLYITVTSEPKGQIPSSYQLGIAVFQILFRKIKKYIDQGSFCRE